MRVLVIEDDASLCATYARALTQDGHQVTSLPSVDAALAELAGSEPDCILLDYLLDKDPSALHEAIQRRGIPVVLVSGVEVDHLKQTAEERGWGYLAKPFSQFALRSEMTRLTAQGASSMTVHVGKSPAQLVAETVVDLVALSIMGAVLIMRRVQSEWLQGLLVVGMLLLAGVRVADLTAIARGIPPRGGVTAFLVASIGTMARHLGDIS